MQLCALTRIRRKRWIIFLTNWTCPLSMLLRFLLKNPYVKKVFKKHFGNKINLVCADVNKNISKFAISNILTSKLVLDYAQL